MTAGTGDRPLYKRPTIVDVARFGRDAAQAMLAWLGEGRAPPAERLAGVELIVRASSAGVAP